LFASGGGDIFGSDISRAESRRGSVRMAGSLRRLIEDLAVVKPGRKISRSMSDAAKAALGLEVPITEVLDNTLGPAPRRGAGAAEPTGR
jgi:hypothetical protein